MASPRDPSNTGGASASDATKRLLHALRKVLTPQSQQVELRAYFVQMVAAIESTSTEDGFASVGDGELEQLAILFSHFDTDSDGLLSRDEASSLNSPARLHAPS